MGHSLGHALIPLLALTLATGACTGGGEPQPANGSAEEPVVDRPIVPRPDPPLDRAGLLAAVAQAASLSASGTPQAIAQRRLDGRPFEVRIRFGCKGPSLDLDETWLGWAYEAKQRRLRVRARPTISADEPLVATLKAGDFEAVEGFWIPRPWLLQAACPAAAAVQADQQAEQQDKQTGRAVVSPAASPAEPVPRSPRVGIAQFFTDADPRTGRRRNRPFESIKVLEEGQPPGSQGYTLVLSGRLRALPGTGVIACASAGPDSPPECIVSADFDQVWIETPDTGEIVAQWGSG